ncbi:hypothetical protein Acsp02_70380 [Actinoplanes sp. NBRC 103695]|nr:hypothetical protein Acsp02_70380 [Actinoplanes sp. NBRC 103695]
MANRTLRSYLLTRFSKSPRAADAGARGPPPGVPCVCGGTGELGGAPKGRRRRVMWSMVVGVITLEAVAAAYAQWVTPDLPLYGNDHNRGDFAP